MNFSRNLASLRLGELVPAALVATSLILSAGCNDAGATPAKERLDAPVSVSTEAVSAVDSPQTLRLTGTLRGVRETDLAANVAGRVLAIGVERGETVDKNALIARVDVRSAALALAEAKVAVQSSKVQEGINQAECARYDRLRAANVVAEIEYDQVTAKCKTAPLSREAAEARQSIAAKNVGDGAVRAPFGGIVVERYVEVGEYVQTSSRVVSIAEVAELKLEFSVPEQNYPNVAIGADVSFAVGAYGKQRFSGKVVRVSGAVRETRDVVVEALVKNPERKLLPGMFAEVELSIGNEALPSVPKSATFASNGKLNVLVVNRGLLEQRVIQPLPAVGERIPVRDGVRLGEDVVKTHAAELKNGQPVK